MLGVQFILNKKDKKKNNNEGKDLHQIHNQILKRCLILLTNQLLLEGEARKVKKNV